jgi:glucosamine-6-phosphate deaminase
MNNDLTAFEKIPVKIFHSSEEGSVFIAKEIAALIKAGKKKTNLVF